MQETLKAVKSQEMKRSQEAKARQQQQQQQASPAEVASGGSTNPTKPTIHSHRRTASSGQAQDLLQQARASEGGSTEATGGPERPRVGRSTIQRRVSMKDEKLRAAIERIRDSRSPPPVAMAAEAPAEILETYSPKLGSKKPDTKPRKIKLGNKAADLFAKLQLRLSTGNKLS